MGNRMLDRLREKDKKGLFKSTQTSISFPTGFYPFDYRNGYMVQVRDLQEELLEQYPSTGIVGGTFITIVGKAGTAKTTFAAQIAANIVRKFDDNAFVQHYDLEQALTYTRIKNITQMTQLELDEKYILKQEKNYIEDIYDAIMGVAQEKEENKNDYMYDTGLKDEFNRPIITYVPTVYIIDSIPTVASKDSSDKMEGGTYANRVAKALAQFYKRLMPIIKTYNITVIAINHINNKIEINPMMKTQPQLLYMKMDESIPGGNAPIYYAHNLLKFISVGSSKFTKDEHGFDGVMTRCELLKSRTNKAGQFCNLIYNQVTGFDPILTQYQFAQENGLIAGKRPYNYIVDYKDVKFDWKDFRKEFLTNDQLRYALFDKTIPILESQLSRVESDFTGSTVKYLDLINRLEKSQEGETFEPAA
jgi:KaiC/GvpD/RAD55 family RecA-like ATPase